MLDPALADKVSRQATELLDRLPALPRRRPGLIRSSSPTSRPGSGRAGRRIPRSTIASRRCPTKAGRRGAKWLAGIRYIPTGPFLGSCRQSDPAGCTADQLMDVMKAFMAILALPQSAADHVDALVVPTGQGEEWRLSHAIGRWEANRDLRYLLIANGNPAEDSYLEITPAYLRGLGLRRSAGVHLQAEPAPTPADRAHGSSARSRTSASPASRSPSPHTTCRASTSRSSKRSASAGSVSLSSRTRSPSRPTPPARRRERPPTICSPAKRHASSRT